MLWELKKCWYRIYQGAFKLAMNFLDWSEPQLLEGKGSVLRLPEFIKSKLLSLLGISEKLGSLKCPLLSKKERYFSLISLTPMNLIVSFPPK